MRGTGMTAVGDDLWGAARDGDVPAAQTLLRRTMAGAELPGGVSRREVLDLCYRTIADHLAVSSIVPLKKGRGTL